MPARVTAREAAAQTSFRVCFQLSSQRGRFWTVFETLACAAAAPLLLGRVELSASQLQIHRRRFGQHP